MIYHITKARHWQEASATGLYLPPGFAQDGFIHCCTAEQISDVAARYFRSESDLVLLCIDPQSVAGDIRWEDLTASGIAYPHIYGALDVAAVLVVLPFAPDPDGVFRSPSQH